MGGPSGKRVQRRRTRKEAGQPIQLVCVQEWCRKQYWRTPQQAKSNIGLCPECKRNAVKKRGWLLDPVTYAECQRVKAEEAQMFKGNSQQRIEAMALHERKALNKLWKRPLPMNPVVGEAALGGRPAAKSGKVGGPSGRDA